MFRKCALVAAALCGALSGTARALPDRPTTVQGTVQVTNPSANILQILQSSPQAIINWNSFNIGARETVRFLQPSNVSAVLNRVTGGDPSVILGMLQGNGRVFLVNPNGILFGPGSVVDVGSFVATTLNMSDSDFLSGHFNLIQAPDRTLASIVNQGTIKVSEGGFITLVSPLIHNDGLILAQSGQVQLGATTQATFSVDGKGLTQFAVADGFGQAQSTSTPGTVLMTSGQVSTLLTSVVKNPGIVEAGDLQGGAAPNTVAAVGSQGLLVNSGTVQVDGANGKAAGSIGLDSSQATVLTQGSVLSANSQGNAGTIHALSAGTTVSAGEIQAHSTGKGDGGFVEVSAPKVNVTSGVDVGSQGGRPGTFLLDPTNISIVDDSSTSGGTGGSVVTTGAISATTGSLALSATNNVTYATTSGFTASSTDLSVTAGNDIVFTSTGSLGISTNSLNLNAGRNLTLLASNGNLGVQTGNSGDLTLQGQSLNLQAQGGTVNLQSGGALRVTGGAINATADSDLSLSASGPVTVTASAGSAVLQAGHTFTLSSQTGSIGVNANNGDVSVGSANSYDADIYAASGSTVSLNATRDVLVNGSANLRLAGSSATFQGRDVTVNTNGILQNTATDLNLAGARNVSVASGGSLNIAVRSVNVTATNSLSLTGSNGNLDVSSSVGNVNLQAGQAATLAGVGGESRITSAGVINFSGQTVSDSAGTDVLLDGAGAVTVKASSGSVALNAGHLLRASSQTGGIAINATGGDVSLSSANGYETLLYANATTPVSVNATRDVLVNGSANLRLAGASATFQGRDVTVNTNGILQNTATDLNLAGARNVSVASAGSLNIAARSVNVTATNSLSLTGSNGNLDVSSSVGNVNLQAGQAATLAGVGGESRITSAGVINFSGQTVSDSAGTDVLLDAAGAVTVKASSGSVALNAGHLLRASSQTGGIAINATGGDVSLNSANGYDALLYANATTPVSVNATRDVLVNGSANLRLAGASATFQGRDVTVNTNGVLQNSATDLDLVGTRNVSVSSSGSLNIAARSVNVTATNSLSLTGSNGNLDVSSSFGNVNLQAGQAATLAGVGGESRITSAGVINFSGQTVSDSAGTDVLLDAAGAVTVKASSGSVALNAGHLLRASSQTGGIALNATGGDVSLNSANGYETLLYANATTPVSVNATGDVLVNGSANLRVSGTSATVQGRDVTINTNGILQNSDTDLNLVGARNVSVTSTGSLNIVNRSVNVTAPNSLSLVGGNGNLDISSSVGNVNLQAGQAVTLAGANGESRITSAAAVNVSASTVSDSALTDVLLDGVGAVSVKASSGSIVLNAGHLLRASSQTGGIALNATGGNVSLSSANGYETLLYANATTPVSVNATGDVLVNGSANLRVSGTSATLQGRDVTINTNGILQDSATDLNLVGARNVSVTSTGSLNIAARGVNVTATNSLTLVGGNGNLDISSNVGNVNLQAGQAVTLAGANGESRIASAGTLAVSGQSISDTSVTDTLASAPGTVDFHAANGTLTLQAGHTLEVNSQSNSTSLASVNGDIVLNNANGYNQIFSAAPNAPLTISAGNNLILNPSANLNLSGSNITLGAGYDLNVTVPTSNLQLNSSNVTLSAGHDLTLTSRDADLTISGLSFSASAGNNLSLGPNQHVTVTATSGDVNLTAGNTLSPQGLTSTSIGATGNVTLSAGKDLALATTPQLTVNAAGVNLRADGTAELATSTFNTSTGGFNANSSGSFDLTALNVSSPGPINLNAAHNLTINQVSGNNVAISGGNVILTSVANISGGNFTISTPGNLTEIVAATNSTAPTLNNLTIAAGEAFGNGTNNSFSIPTSVAGNVIVTISGANDTVFHAAASLYQVGNSSVQLVTTPTTGAVFVQGAQVFAGNNPPPTGGNGTSGGNGTTGSTGASGSGVTTGSGSPVVDTSSAQAALASLSPTGQAQVLQQIGQSQTVLTQSASLDDDLSTMPLSVQDSALRSTSPNAQPISPTLALVVGAEAEMELRQDLGWYNAVFASSYEEMREKDRASFNAMVDQEVREIWEVRYWRRLLEGFILWEDN